MEFFFMYPIATPIITCCDDKCTTVSYGDSCFGVLEFHQIIFWVYHVWRGTRIHNKWFTVIVFVWCFCNNQFVVDYIFCDAVCRLSFEWFIIVAFVFLLIGNFSIIAFIIIIFVLFVTLKFVPWFSCDRIYWHVRVCHSTDILVQTHIFYARRPLTSASIYLRSCRYPCTGIFH